MKLLVQTLVLDGMPFLPMIYSELRKLRGVDWTWQIIEGVSRPEADTFWVAKLSPRLSQDGTTQYAERLSSFDARVKHYSSTSWKCKTAMLNFGLVGFNAKEPYVLLQIDSDEVWTAQQIQRIFVSMRDRKQNCMRFHCRYFLGRDIVVTSKNTFGNHDAYEWHRAWRVKPGTVWQSHEPTKLEDFVEVPVAQDETEKAGLVFDHYAYATKEQVAFKAAFYGSTNNKNGHLYKDALAGWHRLQQNQEWPVRDVSAYLAFVGPNVTADRIKL